MLAMCMLPSVVVGSAVVVGAPVVVVGLPVVLGVLVVVSRSARNKYWYY